jgi:hypothetical protein
MDDLEIKHSQIGYDSTTAPFFRRYIDEDIEEIACDSIIPDSNNNNFYICKNLDPNIDTIAVIDNFIKLCQDKTIQDFYINNNGIAREIYLESWTFLSLEKILDLDSTYRESKITNIIDLGYTYHGMGWVVVAFYYIPQKKIYFRMDGGSNGYDRLDNFNKLKNIDNYIVDMNDNNNVELELGIEFNQLLNIINNSLDVPKLVI